MAPSLAAYIWHTSRYHQIFLSGLSVVVFLLTTVPLELQRRIVNSAIHDGAVRTILWLSASYALVSFVQGAVKLALNIYCGWVSEDTNRGMRLKIHARFPVVPRDGADEKAHGAKVAMILSEVEAIGNFAGISLSQPLLQAGILISTLVYMAYLQPLMAGMCLAIFLPQLLFVPLIQKAINRFAASRIATLRTVSAALVTGSDEGDARPFLIRRVNHVLRVNMGVYRAKYVMNFLMNLLYHLGIAGTLGLGGWYVVHGELDVGTIVAFISGLTKANDPLGELVNWYREYSVVAVKYRLISDTVNNAAIDAAEQRTSPETATKGTGSCGMPDHQYHAHPPSRARSRER